MKECFATSKTISGQMVKITRKRLGMTQQEFAAFINCSKPTIERWESGKAPVTGPAVLLIDLLFEKPDIVEEKVLPKKMTPIRMYYMYLDKVCTVIDIDESNRRVFIKNYTDQLLYRAFGKIEKPTFDDFEEFIESRCFPGSRDKMKIQLQSLNIPFYDPMLIIEKTEGRMAEDDFWIRIER